VFGIDFDVGRKNSLSLQERARVRGPHKECHSFFPSS
jgi:hypothetical protein